MHHLSLDIETFSSNSILTSGVYKYVEAKDFEILLIAYSIDYGPVSIIDLHSMEELPGEIYNALIDVNIKKFSWNMQFEKTCLDKYFGIDMPIESCYCTMAKSALYGYPLSLDKASEVLNVQNKKDAKGKALIKYFTVPCLPTKSNNQRTRNYPEHDPEKWQQFKEYCIQDVRTENDIAKRLDGYPFPASEKFIWNLDQRINKRGIYADRSFIQNAISCDTIFREKTVQRAIDITGLQNPNSAAQLKAWLTAEMEEPVETLRKDDIPAMIASTDSYSAAQVLRLRQLLSKSSVTKYKKILLYQNADSRVRAQFQYYGAGTGRWAGRGVQPHNLPKPDSERKTLSIARHIVAVGDLETLEMSYGTVPGILSELIRTAFTASPGNKLIISDFSAIEARIVAWLAKERWRMDVFNTHGKIYEASGAAMFKVDISEVKKGSLLRDKAKIAELALGYQGGVKAMLKMGAIKMGLREDDLQDIVDRWRNANRHIVSLWNSVGNAAISCVRDGTRVRSHGIEFFCAKGIFFIKLPSGRLMAYPNPSLVVNRYENMALAYEGMVAQGQWGRVETYGGKLVENCLGGKTLVLTNLGLVELNQVSLLHKLWDGKNWVSHEGLIEKGIQNTICIDGVYITTDHKILTNEGWKNASSCEGFNRRKSKLPYSFKLCRCRWKKIIMEGSMRMRQNKNTCRQRISERKNKIMRVYAQRINWDSQHNTRHDETSGIWGLACNDRPLQIADSSSLEKLRRPGNRSLRTVERFRSFLDRYEKELQERTFTGKEKRKQRVFFKKLYLGLRENSRPKSKNESFNINPLGKNNYSRSKRTFGNQGYHASLQNYAQLETGKYVQTPGFSQPVYDLINTGPLNRFTIFTNVGPMIVHNCVQAIARDVLAAAIIRMEAHGYPVVMHVHDEIVTEVPRGTNHLENVEKIMGESLPWAPGLPLKADSFESDFYQKEL